MSVVSPASFPARLANSTASAASGLRQSEAALIKCRSSHQSQLSSTHGRSRSSHQPMAALKAAWGRARTLTAAALEDHSLDLPGTAR